MKNVFRGLVCVVMLICNPMTAMAAESSAAMICDEGQIKKIVYEDLKEDLIALPEVVGETKIVS